jgi:hypothetical protein
MRASDATLTTGGCGRSIPYRLLGVAMDRVPHIAVTVTGAVVSPAAAFTRFRICLAAQSARISCAA